MDAHSLAQFPFRASRPAPVGPRRTAARAIPGASCSPRRAGPPARDRLNIVNIVNFAGGDRPRSISAPARLSRPRRLPFAALHRAPAAANGGAFAGPARTDLPKAARHGAVAQMGERCNRTAEVRGSIPLGSTKPLACVPQDI
jgi:hypothetical protein